MLEDSNIIMRYLSGTSFPRKIADAMLIAALILVWGFASGKLNVRLNPSHTVEASFGKSKQIQKALDIVQYENKFRFVGHFRFNNGQMGLDGFPYIKYTLSEYSADTNTAVDTSIMQNVPIVANMPLVGSLVGNQCYSTTLTVGSPRFAVYNLMGVQSYTSCPVLSSQNKLVGFVLAGDASPTPPPVSVVKELADRVRILQ